MQQLHDDSIARAGAAHATQSGTKLSRADAGGDDRTSGGRKAEGRAAVGGRGSQGGEAAGGGHIPRDRGVSVR